jgi:hypothetical protein
LKPSPNAAAAPATAAASRGREGPPLARPPFKLCEQCTYTSTRYNYRVSTAVTSPEHVQCKAMQRSYALQQHPYCYHCLLFIRDKHEHQHVIEDSAVQCLHHKVSSELPARQERHQLYALLSLALALLLLHLSCCRLAQTQTLAALSLCVYSSSSSGVMKHDSDSKI